MDPQLFAQLFLGRSSLAQLLFRASDLRIVCCNPQAERFYGYPPGALQGQSILQLCRQPEESQAHIRAALVDPREVTLRRTHVRYDGSTVDVHVSFTVAEFAGETFLCKTVQDATSFRTTEELLHQSHERFRAVADYTYDWESWLDPEGRLLWTNPAVERHTGFTVEACMAMHDYPLPLIAAEDRPAFAELVQGALAGSSGNDVEFRVRRRDGSLQWFAVSWQALHDPTGLCRGVRMSKRDIGDRKAIEEQLREHTLHLEDLAAARAEKIVQLQQRKLQIEKLAALGEMAAKVAHEINNPLAGVKNAVRLAADAQPLNERARRLLGLVDREIARIAKLTQEMHQLYRPALDAPHEVDVPQILADVGDLVQAQSAPKRVVIRRCRWPASCRVLLCEIEYRQIVHNLLLNAVEASPDGEAVDVELEALGQPPTRLRTTVRDYAAGIEPAALDHIFEPFFSTKQDARRAGAGLGLAIARSLTTALGGSLAVQSTPGRGATFVLELPVAPPLRPSHDPRPAQ